ncbi:MAG TPA: hypothetical protein VHQ41_01410 [Patescibacteria group bacterium]|nr:hypothetical protein [Patescibacteria group bacterium]
MSHLDDFLNDKLAKDLGCKPEEVTEVLKLRPCCYSGTLSHEGRGLIVHGQPVPTEAEHEAAMDASFERFSALLKKD